MSGGNVSCLQQVCINRFTFFRSPCEKRPWGCLSSSFPTPCASIMLGFCTLPPPVVYIFGAWQPRLALQKICPQMLLSQINLYCFSGHIYNCLPSLGFLMGEWDFSFIVGRWHFYILLWVFYTFSCVLCIEPSYIYCKPCWVSR